jgi:hypothetical protein
MAHHEIKPKPNEKEQNEETQRRTKLRKANKDGVKKDKQKQTKARLRETNPNKVAKDRQE